MLPATELARIGLDLIRQSQAGEAAQLMADAALQYPDDGELWEILGVARTHLGAYSAAVAALETASLLKPLDIGARFCLADAYAASGCTELAGFVYSLIGEDGNAPVWLLPRVASKLGQLGRHADALAVCRTIVRRSPERHEAHFGVGFYLRRLGASAELAARPVQAAHELAPQVVLYRVVLASLWQELGRTDEARDMLCGVPADSIRCRHSLYRMMDVFRAARDESRFNDCRRRLREMDETSDSHTDQQGS